MGIFDNLYPDNNISSGLSEGKDYYMSSEGYRIMTEEFLTRRGCCCANGCKHCPYWPKTQKGNTNLRVK